MAAWTDKDEGGDAGESGRGPLSIGDDAEVDVSGVVLVGDDPWDDVADVFVDVLLLLLLMRGRGLDACGSNNQRNEAGEGGGAGEDPRAMRVRAWEADGAMTRMR